MNKVWRFELEVTDEVQVVLPLRSRILKVGTKELGDKISLWVQANIDDEEGWDRDPEKFETRSFRIIGTGHPIPDWDRLQHLDTVIAAGGALVWHVFEVV